VEVASKGRGSAQADVCRDLVDAVQRLAPPDRLAGMTAAYQALSYTGFAVPFLLASIAGAVAPQTALAALACLAALTLLATRRAARRVSTRGSSGSASAIGAAQEDTIA
jgi:hypothetical protein